MTSQTEDLRIIGIREVSSPDQLHQEYPISDKAAKTTEQTRDAIHRILHNEDDRLLVVIGPCSIHDPDAALDYAKRLSKLRDSLRDDLEIVMRVYFEKPRTTVGWKGLINDPGLNETYEINRGLRLARKLLLDLNNMDMPAATEFLDLVTPQYVADLVSWGAIGARTTESQGHRELASGLSCPIGFKNGTDGTLSIAIDAIGAASRPHHFMSITKAGHSAIVSTSGNNDCHIILRGGRTPNYDAASIDGAALQLEQTGLLPRLMVDCSHANSQKQFSRQLTVGQDLVEQINAGDIRISGIMIESHIQEGRQDVVDGKALNYGQSITDACLGWDNSVPLLEALAAAVRERRTRRKNASE